LAKDELLSHLSQAQHPIYAVLDGAKIDGLPDLLFDHDFSHKPLYRDMGSEVKEINQTAPQFIRFDKWDYWENALTPRQRLESLLTILDDLSAAVFWEYDGEPKCLFRHLRTINNILIPRDADTPPMPDPLDPEGETFGNTATHQQVLFRHADANVMAQVLPVMSPQKLTRIFGKAQAVIFAPEPEWSDGEAVVTITNPHDTYNPTHPLKLTQPDMDAIEAQRLVGQRNMTVKYLQQTYPVETSKFDSEGLYKFVYRSEKIGERIGLEEDDAYRLWALLGIIKGEDTLKDPMLQARFTDSYMRADRLLPTILAEMGVNTHG